MCCIELLKLTHHQLGAQEGMQTLWQKEGEVSGSESIQEEVHLVEPTFLKRLKEGKKIATHEAEYQLNHLKGAWHELDLLFRNWINQKVAEKNLPEQQFQLKVTRLQRKIEVGMQLLHLCESEWNHLT